MAGQRRALLHRRGDNVRADGSRHQDGKVSDHYIYLLGWWLQDDFKLIQGDPASTVRKLFAEASTNGVQVRAMLWDQTSSCPNPVAHVQNTGEVMHTNEWLSTGAAILDGRTLRYGSHHQKILIVKGVKGLIAYCGGVDINEDRILQVGSTDGAPFHDVHCRIQGPAAHELLKIFLERCRTIWPGYHRKIVPCAKANVPKSFATVAPPWTP